MKRVGGPRALVPFFKPDDKNKQLKMA